MAAPTRKLAAKSVEALKHDEATRKNIPTAEYQSVLQREQEDPVRVPYARRNRDLDPQLVWRGKDEQDWSDLVVQAPPLYIQEKVHPKVLIADLLRQSQAGVSPVTQQLGLWEDFDGLPEEADKTDFYQHDGKWSNRIILGDSLQVMASLAEREGLRGKVQCIYVDPPYGIKFNNNFQWSTTSRDVKDGNPDHITREPEQVRAFRDTWRDGIHSYLTYLRDRLTVARDLLADSGSIFVQIGDEQWGRRWITIDTSRVALALARARIMGARFPYYLLADSREGQLKEAEITRAAPTTQPVHHNIRHGFVDERVPHIMLETIANNAEIDVIWDKWQATLEPLRGALNAALGMAWEEWEIPRHADQAWPEAATTAHADWWQARIARQKEIDAPLSLRRQTSSTSTTGRTRTTERCASPGRSPWRASHPTACSA